MRTTDELIASLSAAVPAVSPHAASRRLIVAAAGGAVVAMIALLLTIGVRPDIAPAAQTLAFWMKWAFTASLAALAFVQVRRLARPEGRPGWPMWAALAVVGMLGLMGLGQWMMTAPNQRLAVVVGHTALRCSVAIPLLAVPVFIGLLRAFSRLAPTRLRLTGAFAGLLAGALGACVYALSCPERDPAFMAVWYTVGIAASTALGALAGPRWLKW